MTYEQNGITCRQCFIGNTYICQTKSKHHFLFFIYTGSVQTFTAPSATIYKLEVWGAQGGRGMVTAQPDPDSPGGLGGYSMGEKTLSSNTILYVAIGGKGADGVLGQNVSGGWNGGGNASWDGSQSELSGKTGESGAGGGGATHIATVSGVLSSLSSKKSSILIVAGGGGGGNGWYSGGAGGGLTGETGKGQIDGGSGGTQTSGYAFGLGQSGVGTGNSNGVSGGGGGWYGGFTNESSGKECNTGGGGSGYIGGVSNGSTTNGIQSGHGKAVITWHSNV